MFEYEQDIVQELRSSNKQFEKLYNEHRKLKTKVRDAELGILPFDDYRLEVMKKEKLLIKDRMAAMIAQYKREHSSV